tara:strand:- start:36 stop:851 length:816 start_codon:yes stop_codon:yes gene_type:complete
MAKIDFVKMHGLGNDFVIIDNRKNDLKISKEIINKLSDRKSGAGCDQLITINPSLNLGDDVSINIFNPNGDEAEACGNGTRCVAKLLFKETNKNSLIIKSEAGILHANKKGDDISVNLGKCSTDWKKIPLAKKVNTLNMPIKIENFSNGIAVNVGNPHIVFFGKNIEKVNLSQTGPEIENNELFPNKTNVEIIEIINKQKIKMRVWERGAGITLACGSGACASVYAGMLKKILDKNVEVVLERGSLHIEIINDEAIMSGPAEISFQGNIEI